MVNFNRSLRIQKVVAEIIYLFLIFFFCYTAANKLVNIESFQTNLIKTTMFNKEIAVIFSKCVIFLEIIIIITLLLNKRIGLIVFCFTMLIFTLYISFLRYKGLYEVCGCGGVLNGLKYEYHFLINLSLIFGSFFCLLIFNKMSN